MNEFGSNIERHRRELLVHCYRMLGSLTDAEETTPHGISAGGLGHCSGVGVEEIFLCEGASVLRPKP